MRGSTLQVSRACIILLVAACALTDCGLPSPSPPPPPPAGVLITSTSAVVYSLQLVHPDGSVVAVDARMRSILRVGSARPAPMPVFSITNDRVYYLDGDTDVRWIDSHGNRSSGVTFHVPGSSVSESGFSVTPDDRQVAVATVAYTANLQFNPPLSTLPATLTLSVAHIAGGSPTTIYTATATPNAPHTAFKWPVGWRRNGLVVAVGEAASQNVSANPYGTTSGYEVVAGPSGGRVGGIQCRPAGPLTSYGSACLLPFSTVNFGGAAVIYPAPTASPTGAAVSPDGQFVAYCCAPQDLELWETATGAIRSLAVVPGPTVGWIDDGHVVTEGTLSQHAQVIQVSSGGSRATQALGQVVGRLPGALQ